jgi:hypothetical protein
LTCKLTDDEEVIVYIVLCQPCHYITVGAVSGRGYSFDPGIPQAVLVSDAPGFLSRRRQSGGCCGTPVTDEIVFALA